MSFSENFTRDEKSDDVEYDFSAFWTYAATFLILFLIPLLYKLKNRLFYKPEILNTSQFVNCNCSKCKIKLDKYVAKKKKQNYNLSFYVLIITISLISYFLYFSYEEIMENDGKLKGFNPWDILEIEEDADEKQIKRAFRRLSLANHPDKNPSSQAKAKFIMITKAYESLTDPIAKENFKNWGNPDGAGSMKVGIALPPFVYDKKNHIPILVLFLIFVIIIFPGGVYYWYYTTHQYDESGVRIENHKIFYEFLNENVLYRQMPYIFGASYEFCNLKLLPEQAQVLDGLLKYYKDKFPKQRDVLNFSNKKAICLIYASIDENKTIDDLLKKDANEIMNKIPDLIYAMYKMAIQWTFIYYQYGHLAEKQPSGRHLIKNMGYNVIKTIIEFSQSAHQNLSQNSSPFLQLPHITLDSIRNISKVNKKALSNFKDFLNIDKQELLGILGKDFTPLQILDIENAMKVIPNFDVKVEVFTEGFDEIVVNDLVTIKVTLNRKNLEDNKEIGLSHSNTNIDIFEEKVAILLTTKQGRVIYESLLTLDKNTASCEFKQLFNAPGERLIKLEVYPFTIKGLDHVQEINFDVKEKSESREKLIEELQQRDKKLKIEASFFQEMISSLAPPQEDDEDSEEEGDNEKEEDDVKVEDISNEKSINKNKKEPKNTDVMGE